MRVRWKFPKEIRRMFNSNFAGATSSRVAPLPQPHATGSSAPFFLPSRRGLNARLLLPTNYRLPETLNHPFRRAATFARQSRDTLNTHQEASSLVPQKLLHDKIRLLGFVIICYYAPLCGGGGRSNARPSTDCAAGDISTQLSPIFL